MWITRFKIILALLSKRYRQQNLTEMIVIVHTYESHLKMTKFLKNKLKKEENIGLFFNISDSLKEIIKNEKTPDAHTNPTKKQTQFNQILELVENEEKAQFLNKQISETNKSGKIIQVFMDILFFKNKLTSLALYSFLVLFIASTSIIYNFAFQLKTWNFVKSHEDRCIYYTHFSNYEVLIELKAESESRTQSEFDENKIEKTCLQKNKQFLNKNQSMFSNKLVIPESSTWVFAFNEADVSVKLKDFIKIENHKLPLLQRFLSDKNIFQTEHQKAVFRFGLFNILPVGTSFAIYLKNPSDLSGKPGILQKKSDHEKEELSIIEVLAGTIEVKFSDDNSQKTEPGKLHQGQIVYLNPLQIASDGKFIIQNGTRFKKALEVSEMGKFDLNKLSESISIPEMSIIRENDHTNKMNSDPVYPNIRILTNDGNIINGQLIEEAKDSYKLQINKQIIVIEKEKVSNVNIDR